MQDRETKLIQDLLFRMGKMGLLDASMTDADFDVFLRKVNPDAVSVNFHQRAMKAMREAQAKRAANKRD